MFGRHVLAALAAGVAADQDDVAREAVRRIDPVVRGVVRRKLERALIDAALACDAAQLARPPMAHVMRIAALAEARRPAEAGDPAAVAAAYAELPVPAMPRFPLWTVISVVTLAAALGAATFYIVTRPGPPPRTFVRAMPPPSAHAFQTGGVPLRDAAVDRLLVEDLTDLVVHGGRARRYRANEVEAMLGKLRGAKAIAAHGDPLARAWDGMLEAFAKAVVVARSPTGPTGRDADDLGEAVRELTVQFAAAGLGYFLEGRFKSGTPYVQAYRVEEVVYVTAGSAKRRVLSLRRLDRLNTSYAALGLHDPDVGDPTLHLERIDENVASTVLPVLAAGAPYPFTDRDWLVTKGGKALAAQIGETVRGEYARALGADAGKAGAIAPLLVKRNAIVDEWRDHLERKRIYFVRTKNLFLPPGLLDQLEDVTPEYQRERVAELEDQLAALEAPRIHARVHDLVAATVRRHEAQHGFDFDRNAELRYPAALAEMLGSPHNGEGEAVPIVRSARAELAAYLSQIASDPITPQAALWHLGRNVFDRDSWGTGEAYAAIVVLEGLARQLGATVEGPRFARGINRDRFAGLAAVIASQPADKLRAAATALWAELYGEPLTLIVDAVPGALAAR